MVKEDTKGAGVGAPSNPLLEAALEYAARGWRVFPCVPKEKRPLTDHGFKDATTNLNRIRDWWARWPHANVAVATGRTDDGGYLIVIDVDPRNGGTIPEGLPPTLTALTGGGGYHFYYTAEVLVTKPKRNVANGVDVKAEGGYVLLPPSSTDGAYRWERSDVVPRPAPGWLLEAITKPPQTQQEPNLRPYDDPLDTRPGTLFNRTATWEEILEPEGWTKVGYGPDGVVHWRRPGKDEGISATTGYAGIDQLYVFTTSTELEAGRGYSKFSAYVGLAYGGDYVAAAQGLAYGAEGASNSFLPMTYSFTPAFPADHFVSRFVNYVAQQTDAPSEYAEAAALCLLSMASYRCKAMLAPYPGGLKFNLYAVLVGPTTTSRKSTVQRIASDIAKAVMPPSLLPNRATTEALIKALANRNGLPSLWFPDEFGVTLAEIYNRDFMRGLEEMLLTVYGGDDYEYQRVLDSVIIKQPSLSLLGAATPESISRAGITALESGLLPRFAVVYPQVMPESKPVSSAKDLAVERQWLISKLNQILTWAHTHEEIIFEEGALVSLNDAEREVVSSRNAARLPAMLYKSAALSAVGAGEYKVGASHADSAVAVVRRWADGMSNLVPQMYRHGSDQQFDQQLSYVLGLLAEAEDKRLPRSEIANKVNVMSRRLDDIERTLMDKGQIEVKQANKAKVWYLR